MSQQRFKPPKQFLHQGNAEARIRKYARMVLVNQAALDAYLSQMPPAMRDIALEKIRPYLPFEPNEPLSSLDKAEVEEVA